MNIDRVKLFLLTALFVLGPGPRAFAARKEFKSAVRSFPRKKLIELAMSAAPARISGHASIMVPVGDGKFAVIRKGTNGFTCVPDIDGQEIPSPMCADEATMTFFLDMWGGKQRPTNKMAGVGYMSRGGWHWEKNGRVIMSTDKYEPGTNRVREPAHWMLIYPFNSKKTFLPDLPSTFGTWVMFDGTPYAHLMIYQDPAKLGQ